MATAEKQQQRKIPIKDEPQDDKSQVKGRAPPQQEDDDDFYSDEYDDDYDYSDDDYSDEDEEQETSNKAMQPARRPVQTISSKDQQPAQNIQNGSVTRASEKKGIDDQEGLKLKLDVNLDIEVELKARIHGDLTLALL
ncbi:hypothetical protein BJX76DRAFT_342120 [Aspergillus varians]